MKKAKPSHGGNGFGFQKYVIRSAFSFRKKDEEEPSCTADFWQLQPAQNRLRNYLKPQIPNMISTTARMATIHSAGRMKAIISPPPKAMASLPIWQPGLDRFFKITTARNHSRKLLPTFILLRFRQCVTINYSAVSWFSSSESLSHCSSHTASVLSSRSLRASRAEVSSRIFS